VLRFPVRARDFIFSKMSIPSVGSTVSLGVNSQGPETDCSPPFSIVCKIYWVFSTPSHVPFPSNCAVESGWLMAASY